MSNMSTSGDALDADNSIRPTVMIDSAAVARWHLADAPRPESGPLAARWDAAWDAIIANYRAWWERSGYDVYDDDEADWQSAFAAGWIDSRDVWWPEDEVYETAAVAAWDATVDWDDSDNAEARRIADEEAATD